MSTPKDLGIVLNYRLSAGDNDVSAANKACSMPFYLKRSFAAFSPLLSGHILNILFKHFILSCDAEALKQVQKLAVMFVKGLRHAPYEAALQ